MISKNDARQSWVWFPLGALFNAQVGYLPGLCVEFVCSPHAHKGLRHKRTPIKILPRHGWGLGLGLDVADHCFWLPSEEGLQDGKCRGKVSLVDTQACVCMLVSLPAWPIKVSSSCTVSGNLLPLCSPRRAIIILVLGLLNVKLFSCYIILLFIN